MAEIAKIDEAGGALAAIERGYQMREIEESAYRQQRAVESNEQIVVGVNAYRSEGDEEAPKLTRVDEALAKRRADDLKAHRSRRDAAAAARARSDLLTAAKGTANLVPLILAGVRSGVTLGEISEDLRGVFGIHEPRRG
jgi:methylmalonyl-CoA mutase N-terminal domain/subunit